MPAEGIHVYCFARAGAARAPAPDAEDEQPRVEQIAVGGIAAIYSAERLDELDARADDGPDPDPQRLIERACRHASVVERVMAHSPVAPVRFGVFFSSVDALARFVRRHQEPIQRALNALAGKQEWAFKAFLQTERATDWALRSDLAPASRLEDSAGSPGACYLRRKQLRSQALGKAKDNALALADNVRSDLERTATDCAELQTRPLGAADRGEVLLRNLAFLVRNSGVEDFRRQVARASSACADQGLRLHVTGPWPPYNFCPVFKPDGPGESESQS